MNSKRTYVYNVVLEDWDDGKAGELFTDKELERINLYRVGTVRIGKRIPKTAKAKIYAESCYFSFGARFGRVKQYLNTGE